MVVRLDIDEKAQLGRHPNDHHRRCRAVAGDRQQTLSRISRRPAVSPTLALKDLGSAPDLLFYGQIGTVVLTIWFRAGCRRPR
jgi:hypothetical protein